SCKPATSAPVTTMGDRRLKLESRITFSSWICDFSAQTLSADIEKKGCRVNAPVHTTVVTALLIFIYFLLAGSLSYRINSAQKDFFSIKPASTLASISCLQG